MAVRDPHAGTRAMAFMAGAVFVVIVAAVIYLVFGVGAQTRRLRVAINAPIVRRIAPPRLPMPNPGPAH